MVRHQIQEEVEQEVKVMDSFVDFTSYSSGEDSVREETHVLAVDDSLVDRKVIEKLLKISSCKVTAVDSGKRALELLGLEAEEKMIKRSSINGGGLKIDMIITDYCMPGMTGYELLKKIKESSTFRETPVVIMSSENVLTRIHRCLEEGAEDFIVKPVKLADVKRLMECIMMGMQRDQPDHIKVTKTTTPTKPPPLDLNNKINITTTSNKRKQPDESATDLSISSEELYSSPTPSLDSAVSSSETDSFMSVSPAEELLSSPTSSPPQSLTSSPSTPPPFHLADESSTPTNEVMKQIDDYNTASDQSVIIAGTTTPTDSTVL